MILTRRYIMNHRTDKGSWTKPQIEALGIDWPPRQGWIYRACGQTIGHTDQQIFESRMGVKAFREWLKTDPWEHKKADALDKYEANKNLDRELVAKQRDLL